MTIDLVGFNELSNVDSNPDQTIVDELRFDDALEIPYQMTDIDLWVNYTDDDLYYLDKKVREFLKSTQGSREARGGSKTAASLVFAWIFGRKPTPHDSQVCVTLNRLLKYYCTKYTGRSVIKGQKFSRVYHFSRYAAKCRRPMSLRLRLEENNSAAALKPYGDNKDKRARSRHRDKQDGVSKNGGSSPTK